MPDPKKIIGSNNTFWLWSKDSGFDLTHPPQHRPPRLFTHESPSPRPKKMPPSIRPKRRLLSSACRITSYPLCLVARTTVWACKVVNRLLDTVIPACRKVEIPVVWLGWGLTEEDLEGMPPSIARGYPFELDSNFEGGRARDLGKLGEDMGKLKLEDGTEIEAGRVMMRDQWNTELYPALMESAEPQDMRVRKNRLSGFWGGTDIERALRDRGISTLIFAGGNTDQCVQSSMQDAYAQCWDVLMLSDGCSTSSPELRRSVSSTIARMDGGLSCLANNWLMGWIRCGWHLRVSRHMQRCGVCL